MTNILITERKLVFDKPSNMRVFHMFEKRKVNGTSLCGKVLLFGIDKEADEVTETSVYKKGQDCIKCFRAVGLEVKTIYKGKEVTK